MEVKSPREIILKFPVKLPVSGLYIVGSREPRRPATYIPTVSRRAFHHLRMCSLYTSYSVLGLRSVMTTALDSDERLHSEVGLKQEREGTRQRTYERRR